MSLPSTDMSFGRFQAPPMIPAHKSFAVRFGSSGMKVSKIILGCTVYGSSDWYSWVQNEEESIKQIKAAYVICLRLFPILISLFTSYDLGINTFDTANVKILHALFTNRRLHMLDLL